LAIGRSAGVYPPVGLIGKKRVKKRKGGKVVETACRKGEKKETGWPPAGKRKGGWATQIIEEILILPTQRKRKKLR